MSVSKAPKTVSEVEENLRKELDKERAYAQSLEERIVKIEGSKGH